MSGDNNLPTPPKGDVVIPAVEGLEGGPEDEVTLADPSAVLASAPAVGGAVERLEAPAADAATQPAAVVVEEVTTQAAVEPQAAVADGDDEGAPLQKKMHQFTLRFPVTTDKQSPRQETIDLPSDLGTHLAEVIKQLPNVDLADSDAGRYWAATVRQGRAVALQADVFDEALGDPANHFVQGVETEGRVLKPGLLTAKNDNAGALTGERAVIKFTNSMGLGGIFDVPLWDTGIWVRFKPPSDTAIADLMEQLAQDKIKLGRSTYGLIFSNSTVYTNHRLVQFALNHIYDMTLDLEQSEYTQLGDIISVLDIPNLILGVLGALYSSGFRFERACTANPQKCQHIEKDTLSLDKIQWPNDRKLTAYQKNFMAIRRSRARKLSELQEYKNQIVGRSGRKVPLKSSSGELMEAELRIPTINQYLDGGQSWISGIVDGVLASLGKDASTTARDEYIKTVAQASAMNQYCHAVAKLEKDGNFTEDDATNRQVLAAMSQDPAMVEELTTQVVKYIEDSTLSIIAIPDYTCPDCGKSQLSDDVKETQSKDPEFRNLIPIDMIQVFFILLQRRISLIRGR